MNKLSAIVAIILIVAGYYYYSEYIKCTQPQKMTISLVQLECSMSLDTEIIRTASCMKIFGTSSCELKAENLPDIESVIKDIVDACAKKKLQNENFCIDKYEGI